MLIDLSIVVLFFIVNLIIGAKTGKQTTNLATFSVGHRAFSSLAIFATLTASFMGGGYTIGNAAKVYQTGLLYSFALLGFSLSQILVAKYIAPRMDAHRDCLSIGDIMEKRYGPNAKIITGIFAMVLCSGILGAQVGAMGTIFDQFFNIPPIWGILISFSIIIFYSTVGGMRAVVYTDILQFVILITAIPLTFVIGLHAAGGWSALSAAVPHSRIYFIQNSHDLFLFISMFITFIFGEVLVPPYVQRLFMAKSAIVTERGTLYSGLISIPYFIIVGAIGLIAFTINPGLTANNALPYVVQETLPVAVRGFVIAGLLSIIMSSAAGFLNAAAVSFVNDIIKPLRKNSSQDHSLFWLARASTVIAGIGAVIFALTINNVLDILLVAYNFWAPIILVPLVAVIYALPVTSKDFFVGASSGILCMVMWTYVLNQPGDVSGVVIGVAGNFVGFVAHYYFSRSRKLLDTL